MTSLRTMWGTDLNKIADEWDNAYAKQLEHTAAIFQEKKWLKIEDKKMVLSNTGKLFADRIASELFIEDNNS